MGAGCEVSEGEGVIIKGLVSRTLLPPLSLWLAHSQHTPLERKRWKGGPDRDRSQHCLCMRQGLTLPQVTASFVYGTVHWQTEPTSVAGRASPFLGPMA